MRSQAPRSAPHPNRPAARREGSLALAIAAIAAGLLIPVPSPAATPADSTAVILWEAPGDDGLTGRAARYELRYRSTPIAGADTLAWWTAAIPATVPDPGPAGSTDSVVVRGLDPYLAYYFVLRVADEIPNWSSFSNALLKPPVLDVWPPARVLDLAADP